MFPSTHWKVLQYALESVAVRIGKCCSTHWKVLMAIDQARCERSTHNRPRPKCLGTGRLSIWSYLI